MGILNVTYFIWHMAQVAGALDYNDCISGEE